ncbi:hypothetical protein ACPV4B_03545 [Vibrio parahaemolyticus]|uniref:hypothetical protein n=1 Tax=Vibrio mediterranei TaxID=689 RepID=UPI004068A916
MSVSISKQEHKNDPDRFERLFQLGITYIQQLSGKVWTDYNTHDPGITILEQACFALTDIMYRSDFAINDLLADDHGNINYHQYGLATAPEILSAPPQQPEEYQAYIARSVPQLEQIWFHTNKRTPDAGLYDASGVLQRFYRRQQQSSRGNDGQSLSMKGQQDKAKQNLIETYHRVRGLAEDLQSITIMGETAIHLIASIQISNDNTEPNQLAAQIYQQAAQWLRHRSGSDVQELYDILLSYDGVQQINELGFAIVHDGIDGQTPVSDFPEHASLIVPETQSDILLTLIQNQNKVQLDAADVAIQIDRLFQQYPSGNQSPVIGPVLPTGTHYDLSQYESIQTLFPRNYQLAVRNSFNRNVHSLSQRHQLRSYLLLFDQLMANFCEDLNQLPALFSSNVNHQSSYHTAILDQLRFNGIDEHYPPNAKKRLNKLQAEFDDFPERKNRVYDYLIALYGEHFPDRFHRTFSPYFPEHDINWQLLALKQNFIVNITTVTNRRGLGDNLFYAHHTGGYAQRLISLLGLKVHTRDSDGSGLNINEYLLNVVTDENYIQSDIGKKAMFELHSTVLPQFEPLPERPKDLALSAQQKRQLRASVYALSSQTLPESLLQYGIDNQRYQVLTQSKAGDYRLFFDMGSHHQQRWLYIGRYSQKQKLERYCHWLQCWLIELNQHSETLYVVEPIMLRQPETDLSSLANTVYIVLPGFTARHCDVMFRQQAEQIIRANTPAHLSIQVLWLDFYAFYEFENHYHTWRKQKALALQKPNSTNTKHCDVVANNLSEFLSKPEVSSEVLIL